MQSFKFLIVFMWMALLSACFPIKSIFLAAPDAKDSRRFAYNRVEADSIECFEYKGPFETNNVLKVNDWTSDIPYFVDLDALFESHATRGFILIQNDTILYEYYGSGFNEKSTHPSYSMAKSFVATLCGIAIDEGKLKSVQDLVVDYIPEIREYPKAATLTIKHLLNHSSGIAADLLLDALLYYGDNITPYLKRLHFDHNPGQRQHYLNVNTQLLSLVIERATSVKISEFLEQKIWQKIGSCQPAFWSTDRHNKTDKAFCCLSATLRDYAKLGRLYLGQGQWGHQQVFSKHWYYQSICRDTTEGSSYNYNYSWHLGLKEYGDFMAIGLYKQHIYINPSKNCVMVLLNNKEDKLQAERVNWWYVFRQISDQL